MKMKLSGFLAFTLLSISILSFGLTGAVNAQSVLPVSVETDSLTYTTGNSIVISGLIQNLSEYEQAVSVMVVSPNGNMVFIDQVLPDSSGNYSTTLTAGGTMNSSENMKFVHNMEHKKLLVLLALFLEMHLLK